MFTGIVEEVGEVMSFVEEDEAWKLVLKAERVAEDLGIGDSLACNGCCLSLTEKENGVLKFDLLEESVRLTSFLEVKPGSLINLERSMPANGRFGGHVVSGHVDTTGRIEVFEAQGKNVFLKVSFPKQFEHYVVYKGSITIDGISLTVAEVEDNTLGVWLIPHTLEVTNLKQRKTGDRVNLEFDMLAKYVEKMQGLKSPVPSA